MQGQLTIDTALEEGPALGRKVTNTERKLDTFKLPETSAGATYTSDEVTANCPITGQPDWYTVTIQLNGSQKGLESKSLKLYLQSFKEEGSFCEQFADTICKDVHRATLARSVVVQVQQKSRGGVAIHAVSAKGSAVGVVKA